MNFVLTFFLFVVFFSSAELMLLLKVAANFGFLTTFALCAFTGILGGALVRHQGLQTMKDIQNSLAKGIIPAEEIVAGFMLIITGVLLMLPGFITDTMGFLMLIPAIRRFAARKFIVAVTANFKINVGPISVYPPEDDANDDAIETEAVKKGNPEEDMKEKRRSELV